MKKPKTDWLIGTGFLILTILFIILMMTNASFFDWAFERHHNQWSWYIRPLFIIPYCYFAYKKSFTGMMATTFALFTSMFWFPKPTVVPDQVIEFLSFEKEYLYGNWNLAKGLLSLTVPISMGALGYAFWKRSLWMGLVVIILMTTGKMLWSVQNAGDAGYSIFVPALVGLVLCAAITGFGFWYGTKS